MSLLHGQQWRIDLAACITLYPDLTRPCTKGKRKQKQEKPEPKLRERSDLMELWGYRISMRIFRVFLSSSGNMQIISLKIRSCFYVQAKTMHISKISQMFLSKLLVLIVHGLFLLQTFLLSSVY